MNNFKDCATDHQSQNAHHPVLLRPKPSMREPTYRKSFMELEEKISGTNETGLRSTYKLRQTSISTTNLNLLRDDHRTSHSTKSGKQSLLDLIKRYEPNHAPEPEQDELYDEINTPPIPPPSTQPPIRPPSTKPPIQRPSTQPPLPKQSPVTRSKSMTVSAPFNAVPMSQLQSTPTITTVNTDLRTSTLKRPTKKPKPTKDFISYPTNFVHLVHVSHKSIPNNIEEIIRPTPNNKLSIYKLEQSVTTKPPAQIPSSSVQTRTQETVNAAETKSKPPPLRPKSFKLQAKPVHVQRMSNTLDYRKKDQYNINMDQDRSKIKRYYGSRHQRSAMAHSIGDLSFDLRSRLHNEPLYQLYDQVIDELRKYSVNPGIYDDVDFSSGSGNPNRNVSKSLSMFKSTNLLWCEIPGVIDTGIIDSMTERRKKLQEAKFEVVTSEASYLKSLNILSDHFIVNLNKRDLLTDEQIEILFGTIDAIRDTSEAFFEDLLICWNNNILLADICKVILTHAKRNFSIYKTCYENQLVIDRTLKSIRETNGSFENELSKLQKSPVCQNQTLCSFLSLPKQRITRLPQLIDNILSLLHEDDDEYGACEEALKLTNKILNECIESTKQIQRHDEFAHAWEMLEFPPDIRSPELRPDMERKLERPPEAVEVVFSTENELIVAKKANRIPAILFLFTDLLIVARPVSIWQYTVLQYCQRKFVEFSPYVSPIVQPKDNLEQWLLLTMIENHDGLNIEMLVNFKSRDAQKAWNEVFMPIVSPNRNETLYHEWNCPQVVVFYAFTPDRPGDLELNPGDIINVLRKIGGWSFGKRIGDNETGWFPENYVMEVASEYTRAKNLKDRQKVLLRSKSSVGQKK